MLWRYIRITQSRAPAWPCEEGSVLKLRLELIVLAAVVTIMAALACASPSEGSPNPAAGSKESVNTLNVVSTVSPITSIVENIGGVRINLQGVVPEGVNSHTFEPAPSVAAILSDADLIFLNGLFLEEPTLELARANLKPGAEIVSLGDLTITRDEWKFDFSFPEEGGHPNPHLWPDPILALRYAEIVSENLSERDPANADYYAGNYTAFEKRIQQLDESIKSMAAGIPVENRKLLTYHDSWAYFAGRYGFTVIGAAQPADFSEPSAREVIALIEQIKAEEVRAVFGSEVFPSDVMETIAAEAEIEYIDELSDDDLPGVAGDLLHSYLGLEVANLRIIIPALGGDASVLDGFDTSQVFDGESRAVYP